MLSPVSTGMSCYQHFIYLSRYSRFIHEEGRREVWSETIARYFNFFAQHLKETCSFKLTDLIRAELEDAVLQLKVMPSMRALMTAGPALERDNIAGYNCAYIVIDKPKAFSELMYILLNGTGVGFSVEREYVKKLPEVPETMYPSDTTIVVGDSKLGWAKAFNELVSLLYTGYIPKWDLSHIRPAGSILKTFGGRASGPEPLLELFNFIVATFEQHRGRQLTSLAAHDICCMVGNCVVVGGVRRSALISLSDLSDSMMRTAKSGQWWSHTPYRQLSNNSAVYTNGKPTMDAFMDEWHALYASKSGERGIVSRSAMKANIRRSNTFREEHFGKTSILYRDDDHDFGVNPCAEIILRPNQFCNLTEVVVRSGDTLDELKEKVRLATILGTFQSTLTNFKFISKKWTDNTEEERLLGVSLTGIMDHEILSGDLIDETRLKKYLTELRKVAIETNMEWAKKLGIPSSRAITSVKPSGTVSQLVNSASGIHARHAPFYLRSVRSNKHDPLCHLMIDQGFPHEQDKSNPEQIVFYFPIKSPETSVCRRDMSAIRQLEVWKMYQMYYTEHKPSVTVSVREEEWMEVGAWVYKNFEFMAGVSFLPMSDHIYQQAPYQDLTEEEYQAWQEKMPKLVNWNKLVDYEKSDLTTGSGELACVAGCEII